MTGHQSNIQLLVLSVFGNLAINNLISLELRDEFRIISDMKGEDALEKARRTRPDLALIGDTLIDMEGLELLRKLREIKDDMLVIFITQQHVGFRIRAREEGADDVVTWPIEPGELLSITHALLRRVHPNLKGKDDKPITIGELSIDLHRRVVFRRSTSSGKEELVYFTKIEWRLLSALAEHAGRVMLNAELLIKVWGPDYRDDLQYLRVWVSRLRGKIEPDPHNPQYLITHTGIGYMLAPDDKYVSAEAER